MKPDLSQIDLVLSALHTGPITSLQMIRAHGITRLASHIFVLRQDGYQIATQLLSVPTRRTQRATVAQYTLLRRRRQPNRVAERIAGRTTTRRPRATKARTRTKRSA